MAEKVLKDCKLIVGGYDLSGNSNSISVTLSADVLDKTAFGSSFRKRKSGLNNFEVTGSGFWDSSTDPANRVGGFDTRLFNDVGGSSQVISIAEGTTGSKVIFSYGIAASYAPGGSVGELMGFDFAAQGSRRAVRGKLAKMSTMAGTSGYGPALYLGQATTSTRRFHAALHVIKGCTKSGHTMNITIIADQTSDFPSPTTWLAFAQCKTTNHHSKWGTTKASTDNDWYRVQWKASTNAAKIRAYVSIGKQKG